MPGEHALLSASSSHQWLHCPPSIRLTENLPDSTSEHAEKGTLAHSIAELKARKYFGIPKPMSTRSFNSQMKELKESPLYDKGMDDNTDVYLDHIKELAMSVDGPIFAALETRVSYEQYAPEGFGTADCLIIGGGTLYVVDYKNGAGVPVDAEDNPQLKLYALGALSVYGFIYGDSIQKIHISIVQPNAGGVKQWETTRAEVEAWGENVVKPIAQLAWEGKGEYCPGDWCRFCKVKAQCTARATAMLSLEEYNFAKPPLLSNEQTGDALTRALQLASWVKDLESYAQSTILAGGTIPGFKVVEGRGSRDWTGGSDAAFPALQSAGINEALLWERKPVTPAGLEKSVGKAVYAESVAAQVTKNRGKPALVPESDKRPPYNPAEIAFGGVSNE